jgi:PhnB protein
MPVQPIPTGFHTVTPYLVVRGAARALDFYTRVFGAQELVRMAEPGGKIGHAEIRIGDSPVMLADEYPDMGALSPESVGGTPVSLYVYVENVDSVFDRAIAAGATLERPVKDQFYGDRSGCFIDPFGHKWSVATHVEDVSPEEMHKRARQAMQAMQTQGA